MIHKNQIISNVRHDSRFERNRDVDNGYWNLSWQETSTYCHRGAITVPVVAHGFREKRTCLNTPRLEKE